MPRGGPAGTGRGPAGRGGRPPTRPAARRTSARWPWPTGRAGRRGHPSGRRRRTGRATARPRPVPGGASGPGAGAMAVRTVRHDSRARRVQSPRPTGTQVSRRPSGETGMPVASMTLSSATRASCSSRIRWIGLDVGLGGPAGGHVEGEGPGHLPLVRERWCRACSSGRRAGTGTGCPRPRVRAVPWAHATATSWPPVHRRRRSARTTGAGHGGPRPVEGHRQRRSPAGRRRAGSGARPPNGPGSRRRR